MSDTLYATNPTALCPWHDAGSGEAATAPGDRESARLWLAHAVGDDAVLAKMRLTALTLADGTELSRLGDHQLIDHLAAAVAVGRLRSAGTQPQLRRLVLAPAPAPAPAPPAPAAAPRAAPAAPPPAVETTFGSDLNVAAMVAVLVHSSQDGVPFCEECSRAAAEAAA